MEAFIPVVLGFIASGITKWSDYAGFKSRYSLMVFALLCGLIYTVVILIYGDAFWDKVVTFTMSLLGGASTVYMLLIKPLEDKGVLKR